MEGPRLRIGSPHTAYLKISEGCSNSCAFCSIPLIRGRQISRSIESIVAEARTLIDSGARELNLIAQDTTSYGLDRYGRRSLHKLLQALLELTDRVWFRLMYAFPNHLSNDVLDVMASDPRVCPYLDMPLQHINDRLLQSMGRRMTRDGIRRLLERVRSRMPSGAIRTAFIVGFPGETDETFGELLEFVNEGWFSHMGIFTYSPEPGTPAARLRNNIPESVKESYRDRLMMVQLDNSRRRLKTFIGAELEVLVEGRLNQSTTGPKGLQYVSRSRLDAPEVDGVVYLKGAHPAFPGEFIRVRVVESLDYDLIAEVP
jgi:ribosomal protein S12 methylthiotransferase